MLIHFHSVTSVTWVLKSWFKWPIHLIAYNNFIIRKFSSQKCLHISYLFFFCWIFIFPLAQGCFKNKKWIKLFILFPYCPRKHFNLINCLRQQPTVSDLKAYIIKLNEGNLSQLPAMQAASHPNQFSSYVIETAIQQQQAVFLNW